MKKSEFIRYIETLQKIEEIKEKMRGTGICTIDYDEHFYIALNCLSDSIFPKWAVDLINDFIFTGEDIKIYDSKTKKVINVIDSSESLWEYINANFFEL